MPYGNHDLLHMYRVFLTGSYKPPREFNWGVGVILLVLTLLLSFTGYLLPWDQLAIWAITVGSNMARATPLMGYEGPGSKFLAVGGVELIHSGSDARFLLLGGRFVGETALLRFYVLHCVALPLAAALLIAVHFKAARRTAVSAGALYGSVQNGWHAHAWVACPRLCVGMLSTAIHQSRGHGTRLGWKCCQRMGGMPTALRGHA